MTATTASTTAGSPTGATTSPATKIAAAHNVTSMMTKPTTTKYPTPMTLEEIELTSPVVCATVDEAIEKAVAAQKLYRTMPMELRRAMNDAIRSKAKEFAEDFALSAWSETNRGRYHDKVLKQGLAACQTPGVESLQRELYSGDHGMAAIDFSPFGVIASITPVTNPTATVINNCITILSGGNGVVFNPHPSAMKCTNRAVAIISEAIEAVGAPQGIIASVRVPTIESGGRLLTHPAVAANLVTGGPAVVKVAFQSGKRSFCAGPGNPPVIVDNTADLKLAASEIYAGASFDNNMICSDEKEVFVFAETEADLVAELKSQGAYLLDADQTKQLLGKVLKDAEVPEFTHGQVIAPLVGQDAKKLAGLIGLEIPDECRLLITQVPAGHPFVWTELLMPILPIVAVKDIDDAIQLASRAEYGYRHTASMYSNNLTNISRFSKTIDTSLTIINGSNTAGLACDGEGYTSFSIAGATGEGMTRPRTFVRERRLVFKNQLNFA